MPRVARKLPVASREVLTWALQGLEREIAETRQRLDTLLAHAAALRAQARGGAPSAPAAAPAAPEAAPAAPRKRKVMSPEARRRISLAMKKRWAERKREAQAQPKK
jgi:hypothetical protein